ncbi:MAG: MBOAT family O-acyltransferase [Pseudorhodoplanes sp.]|jgi:alginate O-acetyltransferase complex protein AlgI|nr:MBOAT family O-acyltransferase [Pseudorhodoplanes sp.]
MNFDNPLFLLLVAGSMLLVRLPSGLAGWGLLGASAIFYSFAGSFDFALFAIIIVANWLAATQVQRSRLIFWMAVAGNVAVLAFFKYREMLLPQPVVSDFQRIAIPLGISFYLFHILAYLADLRMKRAHIVGLHKFTLFVGFFPHLIAGPIVRARQLMPQLAPLWKGTKTRQRLAVFGLALCLAGLIKKVIFANSLAPVVDGLFFEVPSDTAVAWAGAWLFGFQIYFDFSGYTDIALGVAMLLGLRLPQNFRTPYLSVDPREFWQRWHITLSTWIRDYLYIPLGGREGGLIRQGCVLVAVMALAGLWHGANWTFVVWGILWGAYIALWRLLAGSVKSYPRLLRWSVHICIVMVLWVFFRSPDISFAIRYIGRMFSFDFPTTSALTLVWGAGGIALLMGFHWTESFAQTRRAVFAMRHIGHPVTIGVLAGLCVLLVMFPNYDINPFIYFRF